MIYDINSTDFEVLKSR